MHYYLLSCLLFSSRNQVQYELSRRNEAEQERNTLVSPHTCSHL